VHWLTLWGDRYYGYTEVLERYDRVKGRVHRADVATLRGALAFARDGATNYYIERVPGCTAQCPYGLYRATDLPL
jgi:hypothetical protein